MSDGTNDAGEHETKAGWRALNKLLPKYELGEVEPGWLARRRLEAARGHFEAALALDAEGWESLWGMGKLLRIGGAVPGALALLQRAALSHEGSPALYRDLTALALELDRRDDAEEYARAAVALDTQDADMLASYALVLLFNSQVKRALGVATNACKLQPNDSRNWEILQLIRRVDKGEEGPPVSIAL
jgi:tetratricopeptide (TPR) repeat protein